MDSTDRDAALRAIDPAWQSAFLGELVRIESINPETWPGGSGEAAMARRIAAELEALGLQPRLDEPAPGRTSAVASQPGTGPRTLLLEAHTDTVQVEGMTEPFSARVAGGRMYGRGACDDKASVVAFLGAVRALRQSGVTPPVTVTFAATSGEEFSGIGIRALMKDGLRADGAIVGEPTRLDVVVAHKGVLRSELVVHGRAAHSSAPAEGRNAIDAVAAILPALQAALTPQLQTRAHPLVGAPTLAFTQIAGGAGPNTIPERCTVGFDRRLVPGETPESALAELRALLAAMPLPDGIRAEITDASISGGPVGADPDGPLAQAVLAGARRHRPASSIIGVPYGTDASHIALYGVPTVIFGPGDIAQAHAAVEWVDLAEVNLATAMIVDAIFAFAR